VAIQLPYTGVTTNETIPAPYTNGGAAIDLTLKEDKANKGVANGYAPLDGNAKIPTANLPDQASLDAEVDGKITTHNSATTVHGIANTANLVLTNDARLSDSRTPTAHTHAIADVTGLQTAIDGKQASGSYAPATGISPSAITGTAVVTDDSRLSGISANSITTSVPNQISLGSTGGSITSDGYGGSINTSGYGGSIRTNSYGGTLNLSDHGGAITTGPYGGSINTTGQGSIELGSVTQGPSGTAFGRTILRGSVSGNSPQTITLPNATGTIALTSDSRFTDSRTPTAHTHTMSDVTSLQATLTAFAIALG
jgi:hypothetical protein